MKRIGIFCLLILGISFVTGCDNGINGIKKDLENLKDETGEETVIENKREEKIETRTCYTSVEVDFYQLNANYTIYSKNGIVEKVETVEIVTSDDDAILNTFETTLETQYKTMKKTYGGYDYKVVHNGNTVKSEVTIDYNKVDMKQLAKDNDTVKSYMNSDNRFTVNGIIALYESMNINCN